ncbi:hypothetical protein [Sedimenticola sp.]|uniref:hypothetical protein n=1 Tax=Sedimenticola sp. TaxID=1940285 RepID=UPI003D0ACBB5
MSENKCPFHHSAGRGQTNREWRANLIILNGNVALESMEFKTFALSVVMRTSGSPKRIFTGAMKIPGWMTGAIPADISKSS